MMMLGGKDRSSRRRVPTTQGMEGNKLSQVTENYHMIDDDDKNEGYKENL